RSIFSAVTRRATSPGNSSLSMAGSVHAGRIPFRAALSQPSVIERTRTMVSEIHNVSSSSRWGADTERAHRELAAQLQALNAGDGSAAWLSNAGVLRQLARMLAERLESTIDRIIVPSTVEHHVIGAALALATGLRWSAVGPDMQPVVGDVHDGERLALVGVFPNDLLVFEQSSMQDG